MRWIRANLFFPHGVEPFADVGRAEALFAEGGDGEGVVTFGEASAGVIADELVVMVGGRGEFEEGLEEAVNVGGGEEVCAPGDEGDFLGSVIDDDGEVVGGADVFSGENDVS